MARNYSQIMCAIWDEADFLALSEDAQRAYFLLVTQKDISAAGVLHMWIPRWVAMSRTATEESLKAALHELKVARYIVPDWITGELLVRTFVKWDGGYNNLKRKPLIIREALGVRSREIKQVLRVELEKLGIGVEGLPQPPPPTGTDSPPDRASDVASHGGHGSNGVPIGPPSPSMANGVHAATDDRSPHVFAASDRSSVVLQFPQVDRASDATSDRTSPSRGVVGGTDVTTGVPQPRTRQPVPPPAGDDSDTARDTTTQHLVGEWIDSCRKRPPGTTIGHTSKQIKLMLDEGIDPADIRSGLAAWASKGLHPSALASVVNQHMNANPAAGWSAPRSAAEDWQLLKRPQSTGTDGPPVVRRAINGGGST